MEVDPTEQKVEIDENLHSRQIAVYGHETMKKISDHSLLISGLNGLGAEIAKNVILANFKKVTLHDTVDTTFYDLSSHFYLSEDDVGKNRARACANRLKELNPTVQVEVNTEELTHELIKNFDTVVILDTYTPERALSENKLIELNDFCRSQKPAINFITGDTLGVFGRCFCDFGNEFVVTDVDGEQPFTGIVASIVKDENPQKEPILVVNCVDEERIEFCDNDLVAFSEVEGLVELNTCGPLPVTVKSPYSFTVPCPESILKSNSNYTRGGLLRQVKLPKTHNFRSFGAALNDPGEMLESDFSKFGRSTLLHVLFRAAHTYRVANAGLPEPGNTEHAKLLLSLTKHINTNMLAESARLSNETLENEETVKIVEAFSRTARGTINPMCAIYGGIIGQEIIKGASGKFTPIKQFFYIDFVEALPETLPSQAECSPTETRYDGQIAVFGKDLQQKIGDLKYFVVGAGALGCEMLKNFAMMGLGGGNNGKVTVTDDDTIEKSNLSRQFLFRNWDVKKPKSSTAADAVKKMNPNINITPLQDRVSTATEDVFNDEFWQSLDGVCNALDNVKARLYVDSRCVFYNVPLLESGTLGTKCNTQVVIPHQTENYGASTDPPEKQAPDCTLHSFPHNINHCLSWGRSEFVGNFESTPSELKSFLQSGSVDNYVKSLAEAGSVPQDIIEKLNKVMTAISEKPVNFEDCVGWARRVFEDYFVNRIVQLTFTFPKDAKTQTGLPFWSPPKRFPTQVTFNPDDATHMQFLISASILRAKSYSIPNPQKDADWYKQALTSVIVPDFVPRSDVKIETDPNAQSRNGLSGNSEGENDIQDLKNQLSNMNIGLTATQILPEEFEKDDDTNYHMDFISSTANLRARCYEITEIDKFQAKLVAGRIIPAIATTTAMATGFVCMELYKVIQKKGAEKARNLYANLAIPLFAMSEPIPPKKSVSRVVKNVPDPLNHPEYVEEENVVAYPEGHTCWDRLDVKQTGNMTLKDLFSYFEKDHKLSVSSFVISTSDGKGKILFNSMMQSTKANLTMTVSEIVNKFVLTDSSRKLKYFVPSILFENDDGATVETPDVVLWL